MSARRGGPWDPILCELCGHITNGFIKKDIVLCSKCSKKYSIVPNHIPVDQWERYRKACKKKRLANLGVSVKNGKDRVE